jgi:hypothetical protein
LLLPPPVLDRPGPLIETLGGTIVLFQLKIGKFQIPATIIQGFKGNTQVLVLTAGTGIQIQGLGTDMAPGITGNDHLNRRLSLRPGLDVLHHQTADVQRIRHSPGITFIEVYLHTSLIIVNRRKHKPFLDIGILINDGIEFAISNFYANS